MGWRYVSPFFFFFSVIRLASITMNLHTDNGNKKKKTRDNITEVRAKTLRANMTKVATPNHLCLGNPLD